MTAPWLSLAPLPRGLLAGTMILLNLLTICVLNEAFATGQSRGRRMGALCAAALEAALCVSMLIDLRLTVKRLPDFAIWPINPPLWAPAVFTLAMLVYVVQGLVHQRRWRRSHITRQSIKEAFDALPEGMLICRQNGLPLLVNPRMTALCEQLTGRALNDGARFLRALKARDLSRKAQSGDTGRDALLVRGASGETLQVRRRPLSEGAAEYEVVATDVSVQYALNRQLIREMEELAAMEVRLRAYGDSLTHLTREREILSAKQRLHDELGQLILRTEHCLDTPDEDRAQLLSEWESLAQLFSRAREDNGANYARQELEKAAASIDVQVEIEGELPWDEKTQNVFLVGAMECLLNAYRHAGATLLHVRVSRAGGLVTMRYTNNGTNPTGPVREGGGLSMVRAAVEENRGEMQVEWENGFALTLTVPEEGGAA